MTVSDNVMGILSKIKERDGISESHQISEALRLWCQSNDFGRDPGDLMREAERIVRQARKGRSKETTSGSK